MITTFHATTETAAYAAVPCARRRIDEWRRALPMTKGEVSVQGTGVFGADVVAAAFTFPGTPAWSSPT